MGNLISILMTALIGFTPSSSNNEYIIKTSNFPVFQQFISQNNLSVEPLITYPNPSQDVLKNFGDYYVLTDLNDSLINVTKKLEGVSFFDRVPIRTIDNESSSTNSSQTFSIQDTSFKEPYKPNDPMFDQQWAPKKIEADWAWNLTRGDSSVIINFIDCGVDTTHKDLKENLINGWNFINNTTNVQDLNGHGTNVSGIAGAKIDNNTGISGIAGNCSIMPLKIDLTNIQQEINAILYTSDYISSHPTKKIIINLSLGGDGSWNPEKNAVDQAYNKGCFLCASAGNGNKDASNHYPSGYEHVMGVGASTSDDSRWSNSNFGSTVDVYAPGLDVLSTDLNNKYTLTYGTSMSTSVVAGLAALIWSAEPTLTNQQVWDRIVQTSDTITIDKGKVLRINARKALGVEKDTTGIFDRDRKIVNYKFNVPSLINSGRFSLYYNGPATDIDAYDITGRFVSGITTTPRQTDYLLSLTGASGKYFFLTHTNPMMTRSVIKLK